MLKVKSHWEKQETENIIFYFLKPAEFSSSEKGSFIDAREEAYKVISQFLHIDIEPKITFYVFPRDRDFCRKYLWVEPNQAYPGLFVVFSRISQTAGHELAHIFSYYLNNAYHLSYKILSEGLATWLDQSERDFHKITGDLKKEGKLVSLNKIVNSNDFKAQSDLITYPECASFVGFLIDKYGLESFKQIWVKEDLENTIQKVYKKSLGGLEEEWLVFLTVH
ncbi:hypothetical protein KKB83_04330 [Patescibacteria group bacterium]|nr:hypothetical protein [Patescibacteria group bacterium]